ncbi:hypothetical protein [Embleya sp. AB8]|uniref:hypothetical protein n=1 Tax=Embleya sp. AB8 TaxID=3156304 RepID=UPI003C73BEB5
MYLIHARLRPRAGRALHDDTGTLVLSSARPGEGIEHVAFHPDAKPLPVLGLFVTADSLAAAEATALAVCRRAIREQDALRGIDVVGCAAPLVTAYYEHLVYGRDDVP